MSEYGHMNHVKRIAGMLARRSTVPKAMNHER
jgi:hypothetical protein